MTIPQRKTWSVKTVHNFLNFSPWTSFCWLSSKYSSWSLNSKIKKGWGCKTNGIILKNAYNKMLLENNLIIFKKLIFLHWAHIKGSRESKEVFMMITLTHNSNSNNNKIEYRVVELSLVSVKKKWGFDESFSSFLEMIFFYIF